MRRRPDGLEGGWTSCGVGRSRVGRKLDKRPTRKHDKRRSVPSVIYSSTVWKRFNDVYATTTDTDTGYSTQLVLYKIENLGDPGTIIILMSDKHCRTSDVILHYCIVHLTS